MLLAHTLSVCNKVPCIKQVYYADEIHPDDLWDQPGFEKRKQQGDDLGERMSNAFTSCFNSGFKKVLIIGSDCYQLSSETVLGAIKSLDNCEAVLGPTFDGGYYLLGMNRLIPQVFAGKAWSTDTVALDTINDLEKLNVSFRLIEKLHDVDEPGDLAVNGIEI